MALSTNQAITLYFDKTLELMNSDNVLAKTCDVFDVPQDVMQNSGNVIWRKWQQHAPIYEGWDLSSQLANSEIIQQWYPASLGTPYNDIVSVPVYELRNETYINERAMEAARKLSSDQNARIANLVAQTGSLYYTKGSVNFEFISEAEALLSERQTSTYKGMSFFLNNRDYLRAADNLAQKNFDPVPTKTYRTGLITRDVSGFDVYKTAANPTLRGAPSQSGLAIKTAPAFGPAKGTQTGFSVTNEDARSGQVTITSDALNKVDQAMASTNSLRVGDVITVAGVNSVTLRDKIDTGQPMTFRIVALSAARTVSGSPTTYEVDATISPRPIALSTSTLNAAELACANVNTDLATGAAITRQNTLTSPNRRVNTFWTNDSVDILSGDIPLDVMENMTGTFKVVSETLDSGNRLYLAYQGNISSMSLVVRLFTWYGLTNKNPAANGCAIYSGSLT